MEQLGWRVRSPTGTGSPPISTSTRRKYCVAIEPVKLLSPSMVKRDGVRWPFVDDSVNPHLGMLLSRLLCSLRFETLMGFCATSDGHTVNDEIAQSGIYVILTVKVSLMDVMPRG